MATEELFERIYIVASQIPKGRVATYGQLAFYVGVPRGGRLAGRAMANAPQGRNIPCHRVVNSAGRCAPGYTEQKKLLEKEGIVFSKNGHVDMQRHLWNPGENAQNESELSQIP